MSGTLADPGPPSEHDHRAGKRPRGTCSACGADRALRADGTIGAHSRVIRNYRSGSECAGVGKPPREAT